MKTDKLLQLIQQKNPKRDAGRLPLPRIQTGSSIEPYVTTNPNDPRIKAYADSLSLYKENFNQLKAEKENNANIRFITRVPFTEIPGIAYASDFFEKNGKESLLSRDEVYPEKIKPIYFDINQVDGHTQHSAYYKKPVQKVELDKSIAPIPSIGFDSGRTEGELQNVAPNKPYGKPQEYMGPSGQWGPIPQHLQNGSNWRKAEDKEYQVGGTSWFNQQVVQDAIARMNAKSTNSLGKVISTPESRSHDRRATYLATHPEKYNTKDYRAGHKEEGLENDILSDPVAMAAALTAGGIGLGTIGAKQIIPSFLREVVSQGTMGASELGRGLLSNAYKLNPWKFKADPEAYYKTLGNYENVLNKGLDIHDVRLKYHNNMILDFDEADMLNKFGKGNKENYERALVKDVAGKMYVDDAKPPTTETEKKRIVDFLMGTEQPKVNVPNKSVELNTTSVDLNPPSTYIQEENIIKPKKFELPSFYSGPYQRTKTSRAADKWLEDWFYNPETKKKFIDYGGTESEWSELLNTLENPIKSNYLWGKNQPGGVYVKLFNQASIPLDATEDIGVHEGIHKAKLLLDKHNPILHRLWNDFTDAVRLTPTEAYPEIFRFRNKLGLKPGQTIDLKTMEDNLHLINDGYHLPYKIKDKNKLLDIINKAPAVMPYAVPTGVVGAGMYGSQQVNQQKYGGSLPKAQLGNIFGTNNIMNARKEFFPSTPLKESSPTVVNTVEEKEPMINLVDPRKIRLTTGKPINPNRDLLSGEYPLQPLTYLLNTAKNRHITRDQALDLAAIGLQESGWGKTDESIGHVLDGPTDTSIEGAFIDTYLSKMNLAAKLGYKDDYHRYQAYNGYGKIYPDTEKKYHGYTAKAFYGVPVPKTGIDLRQNPLYGKQIVDIRNNVLLKNPEFLKLLDSVYPVLSSKNQNNKTSRVRIKKSK